MLLPLHLNLPAGVPAPEAEVVIDKGLSAGSGPQWWEGEWITPGVTHYLPERPPEDIVPLRPKVEAVKQRLRAARPLRIDGDYLSLQGKVGALVLAVAALESQASQAVDAANIESLIRKVTERYRLLASRATEIEQAIAEHETAAAHRRRLHAEDEEIMQLIMMEVL